MQLNELKLSGLSSSKRLKKRHNYFNNVLSALGKRELPDSIVIEINSEVDKLNKLSGVETKKLSAIRKALSRIIKLVQKELNWVPRNYYRNLWMALGMTAFGIPMGVAFGMSLQNMGFIGIGIPIGLAIGLAVGTSMDKKAAEEGRQIDIDYEI